MERYRQIEKESGFHFFEEVGYLRIGQAGSPNVEKIHELAKHLEKDGVDVNLVDDEYAKTYFPYLR